MELVLILYSKKSIAALLLNGKFVSLWFVGKYMRKVDWCAQEYLVYLLLSTLKIIIILIMKSQMPWTSQTFPTPVNSSLKVELGIDTHSLIHSSYDLLACLIGFQLILCVFHLQCLFCLHIKAISLCYDYKWYKEPSNLVHYEINNRAQTLQFIFCLFK